MYLYYEDGDYKVYRFPTETEARDFYEKSEGDRTLGQRGDEWQVELGYDPCDVPDGDPDDGYAAVLRLAMERNPDIAFSGDDLYDY